jgi:hypothetical protein
MKILFSRCHLASALTKMGFPYILCLAHCKQMSIWHGSEAADTHIADFLRHFKHSAAKTSKLAKCSKSPLNKLQQEVPTRWNSV